MPALPMAFYDAFSDRPFGGSQAAILSDAGELDGQARTRIAREMGLPATCFVSAAGPRVVEARFLSTVMELPMCGHGTIALMTRMAELDLFDWEGAAEIEVTLNLPAGPARVSIARREDGRPHVMLTVRPPEIGGGETDRARLARLLGLEADDFSPELPIEVTRGDFIHLVVPLRDLAAAKKIEPDFSGLVPFCHDHEVETVVVFCDEVERPESTVHVRDFCPAVGVAESAAAGTTNAALSGYLVRHGLVRANGDGLISVQAEQGLELGRPSSISTVVEMAGDTIVRLRVGGVATKVLDGALHL